ncbi:tetratricopeptide repeat protein [Flammeovirgaceae bacterium SG7u.111]|nr:tetratricopeptide repeat protein [Flammeovirgaceae bacterium SG7u.132]WPO35686.1 tetratricopeptide repeat protein [Flammeovirgaceae bacterium SG7u.111]
MKQIKISLVLIFCFLLNSFAWAQSEAEDLADQATQLITNHRYEEAIVMLDQAIKKDPKYAKAYFKKANCYIGLSKFKNAIQEMERAVKVKPDYYEAYEVLGNLYAQFRNAPKSVKNYESAFANDNNVENRLKYKLQIVDILFTVQQHQQILAHIEDAKKLGINSFDLKFLEAQYFNYIGDYKTASDLLAKIINEVPEVEGNEKYFFELGYAYHKMGEYAKGEEYFKKADNGEYKVKIRQFTPEHYLEVAEVYFSVYEYGKSEDYLKLAQKINPTTDGALDLEAKLAAVKTSKTKLIEVAEKQLVQAEKDGNVQPDKYYELAVLFFQNEEYSDALEQCAKYNSISTRDYKAMFLQVACEYKLKQPESATEMLSRSVKNPKLTPEIKAKFNFLIGLSYESAGNYDQAEGFFRSAAKGPFRGAAAIELEEVFKSKQKKAGAY